jgi:hypothetical protein
LALTRRALSLTRFQMAQLLGTDMPTWGTYKRIRADQALKLCAYGIPRLGLRRQGGQPAPAHPRQNSELQSDG